MDSSRGRWLDRSDCSGKEIAICGTIEVFGAGYTTELGMGLDLGAVSLGWHQH